jgi:hypothetical protein
MKSESGAEWVRAFGIVLDEMTSKGFKPKLQTMYNEASAALKNYVTQKEMSYQLVPPHCHRTNAAERAIRTFKEHFKSDLTTVDPAFPIHLWDILLPQAEITLNLLRSSRLHPQLSAAVHYHGLMYYNRTAFGPPGYKIIAHEKPSQRRTWAAHGQPGWSLGPAMHHYRCQKVYITATVSERIVDTLNLFPHNSPLPQMSSTDRVLMAAQDMTDALKHPHPDIPFAAIGDDTISALATLLEILTRKVKKAEAPVIPPAPIKYAANKQPKSQVQPTLTSPLKRQYQKRSQIHVSPSSHNAPQPPRLVTPATRNDAPPRVPTGARQLSPRNLSQDFLDMSGANCAIAFGENHWTKTQMMNSVIHPVTVKEMQYKDLMKYPQLGPLFEIGLGNELGRICQGIRYIPGTNTAFFVELSSIPKDRKITYGKLVCD